MPDRPEIETDLGNALAEDQFFLMYQPIYDLEQLRLAGFEALLRWQHPTRGVVAAADVVPLLETSGQIVEVGRWVLQEACTQMTRWRTTGSPLMISVNISGRQLAAEALTGHVQAALAASHLLPGALTLEITEAALIAQPDTAVRRLREIKALGVQIAIDDFGTGRSSLAYLQQFPIDCIKIDRRFTDALTRSPAADALIHTLVQLGRDLGLRTLAEGVETDEQMSQLRREHVTSVQGFLFARPMTVEAIEAELLPGLDGVTPP